MSELLKVAKHRRFPVRVKLSAVRERLLDELGFAEVLIKYDVSFLIFQEREI